MARRARFIADMTVHKRLAGIDALPTDSEAGFDAEPEAGFNLADFLRMLRVRRGIIVGTAVTVVVVAMIVVLQMTPLYSGHAVVMLDEQKNKVEDVGAVLSGLPTDQASIQNQVQILTSRELAGRVIDKLNLDRDPEFNTNLAPGWLSLLAWVNPKNWFGQKVSTLTKDEETQRERDNLIDKFLGRLSVDPIGLSTALNVTFESESADQAARITNAIADAYVEDQLNAKFEATQKATKWLSDRIQQLATQVQAAEAAVQQYKAENNLTETATGGSVVDQQLATVNGQLILAKSDLAEKQATYAQVASLARSGRQADVAQVVASPLITQLRGQETDLIRQEAELSTRYGPRFPKMIDLENERKNLDAKIAEEVQRIVESVRNDVSVAAANVNSLQGSLNQLEQQSQTQNKAKVQLKSLESTAASARSMYEAFLSRLKETQGQEGIQTPDARVISPATVPNAPSSPQKGRALGLAAAGGLMLGLLLAFAVERLDSGFRTTSQVENLLGLPVLATIPEVMGANRNETVNAADRIVDKPMSSFAEAVRGLQLGLTLSNVDQQPKIILVTSSVPGEGKTTLAVSLARLAARNGKKVVIVDGDLRRPTVAETVGLGSIEHDIVDALTGVLPLDQCFSRDTRSDALILACGSIPSNAMDLIGSQAMEKLLADLARVFDFVIVDSAPLLPVNDTKILSRLADTVLFVTRWEKTPRDAVVNAVRSLADVDATIAGVALARADTARFQQYNYGYQNYYSYNKYYSD